MTLAESPHRPDKAAAFALLTAWRSEAPDLEHPEEYSAEGDFDSSSTSWVLELIHGT